MSIAVIVDDANSRIFYSGSWHVSNDTSLDPNGTAHGVVGSGSTVSGNATFTFTGTAIAVVATISPADFSPNAGAPVATFNVDGIDAAQFIPQQPTTIVKQLIYGAFNLEDREHTLFISISALNGALWIDYLEYAPTTGSFSSLAFTSASSSPPTSVSSTTPTLISSVTSSPTSTLISSTSSMITTTSLTTSTTPTSLIAMQETTQSPLTSSSVLSTNTTIHTMTAAADNWSMSTSTPGKSNSLSTGAIVGAAVGGTCLFFAILAAVLFYLCRRRRKQITHTRRDLSSPSQMDFWSRPLSTPLMTPFTLSESPTRATAAPPTPTAASKGFYLHGNQTSGSKYSTQGNTFKEKAGFHNPATSKTNLINFPSHFESIPYDTKVRSHTRGSRPRIYSPHDLALGLPPPPPPPPSQFPTTSNSDYGWLEEESPPSYRPYTLE